MIVDHTEASKQSDFKEVPGTVTIQKTCSNLPSQPHQNKRKTKFRLLQQNIDQSLSGNLEERIGVKVKHERFGIPNWDRICMLNEDVSSKVLEIKLIRRM